MGADQLAVEHGANLCIHQPRDLRHFVRGAEAVEDVQEGYARFERRRLRDQREVHHLLIRVRKEHAPAGRARRHHVAVVAEDRERVRRHGACGDVKDGARQLAGDLEHIRNHQQQPLARREGG